MRRHVLSVVRLVSQDPTPQDAAPPGSHYATLGVTVGASQRDIRSAYRQLAARWHPDKWMTASPHEQESAQRQFADVQTAYDVLGNVESRVTYDMRSCF
jgi:DnaJ-class molecular chaperone